MANEKAPAFQFYPKDFLTDSHVVAMTLQELGAYITLLCLCWMEGSLPIDLAALARLCRVSPLTFERLWPALEPCFTIVNDRLVQPRIERERRKQETWRALKVEAGKKGGRPKKADGKHRLSRPKADAKQTVSRGEPNESPPSSSSSSVSDLPSSVSDLQPTDPDRSQHSGVPTIPDRAKPAVGGDGRFDRFWTCYPNKKGKDDAWKAWQKRHPTEALTDLMVAAVLRQKAWPTWTKDDGRFIPHPATWLNRGSWDDELTEHMDAAVSDRTRINLANRDALLARVKNS